MDDPRKLPTMSRDGLTPPDITEEEMLQQLQNYLEVLTDAISSASSQVSAAWKDPLEGGHDTLPGEWVLVKKIQNEPLGVNWEGPYQQY
ncbi:hypothetical protein chiPu_0010423 [Chiloscyllium punctatum]|uniref:Murine leukemia virus integrase C-terminal domain-containing protein n=1 Tax=Chiloscyllium punctatum TaxID=137246 RepID=A0A401SNJ6_CHIPU|nr:hypothetical protein [Chiloscyllium punctatum]